MILVPLLILISGAYHSLADLTFTILHDNDHHGRFEETTDQTTICPDRMRKLSCVGGFARRVHEVKRYRHWAKEGNARNVIYLYAGDLYVGTTWFTVHKWNISAEMMNFLSPDIMTLGNHEFDFGLAGLEPFIENCNVPIVLSNADFNVAPKLNRRIQKSKVLEIGGHKVGIIGCLTKNTNRISSPAPLIFTDEIAAVKEESERLDSQGVKIIILLSHVGIDTDKELAYALPLIDVIVGGHSHTFLYTGKPPDIDQPKSDYPTTVIRKDGTRVPIVHAFAFGKYLGVLNVTFDNKGNLLRSQGKPILLSNSVPQDEEVLKALEKFRAKVSLVNNKIVGKTQTLLNAAGKVCKHQECNIGNLITDAMVSTVAFMSKSRFWTTHPIGLLNGGGIRASLDPSYRNGNITYGDVLEVQPFDNTLVKLSMKGAGVRALFEAIGKHHGIFEMIQVSGLRIIYDMSKPKMERIISAKARCGECLVPIYEDLSDNRSYNIVSTDYTLKVYKKLTNLSFFNQENVHVKYAESTVWYLETHSPVLKEISGRLIFGKNTSQSSIVSKIKLVFVCLLLENFNKILFI